MRTLANIVILAVGLQTLLLVAYCPCAAHGVGLRSAGECDSSVCCCADAESEKSVPASCCAGPHETAEETSRSSDSRGDCGGKCRCTIGLATLPLSTAPPQTPLVVFQVMPEAAVGAVSVSEMDGFSMAFLVGPSPPRGPSYLLHCVFLC